MVKKKSVKKIPQKKVSKKLKIKNNFFYTKDKTQLAFNNLIFFAVLSLVSLIFFQLVNSTILGNLFFILAVTLGFTAIAFLIVLLTLIIKKIIKK